MARIRITAAALVFIAEAVAEAPAALAALTRLLYGARVGCGRSGGSQTPVEHIRQPSGVGCASRAQTARACMQAVPAP